jgi:RHS repeat-associated protein
LFVIENNKYIYSYTDHLGNVRLNYFKNSSGSAEVLEENSYYPFGLKHFNNLIVSAYNYQYNGKEYQKETGWSDYGARMYMPDMARWGVIDPLAEASRRFTPYNYALNNPIMFIDPDGRKAESPDQAEANIFKLNAPEESLWWAYAKGGP